MARWRVTASSSSSSVAVGRSVGRGKIAIAAGFGAAALGKRHEGVLLLLLQVQRINKRLAWKVYVHESARALLKRIDAVTMLAELIYSLGLIFI